MHLLFTCQLEKWLFSDFARVAGGIDHAFDFPILCFLRFVFSDNKSQLFFRWDSKSSVGKCLIMFEDSCYVRLKTFRSRNIEISSTFSLLLCLSVESVGSRSSSVGSCSLYLFKSVRQITWIKTSIVITISSSKKSATYPSMRIVWFL